VKQQRQKPFRPSVRIGTCFMYTKSYTGGRTYRYSTPDYLRKANHKLTSSPRTTYVNCKQSIYSFRVRVSLYFIYYARGL
jgi:hypothetical protein